MLSALSIVGLLACGDDDPKPTGDGGGAGDATVLPDGARPDGSVPPSDAKVGDAANADASDGFVKVGENPVLASVLARQSGRFGADLRFDVVGSDPDGNAVAIRVTVFDALGGAVALPSNDVAMTMPGEADLSLEDPLTSVPTSTSFVTLPGFYVDNDSIKRAKVALLDDVGNVSNELEVDITAQPVRAKDAACDVAYVADRCGTGLGCKGTAPSICQDGVKPVLTQVGYFSDEFGDRILIEGTDPDDDVASYTIEFLDANNNPITVDLDGDASDTIPPASSFTTDVTVGLTTGKFFFRFDPGTGILDVVPKVRLTVTDSGMRKSDPLLATLGQAPLVNLNAACDTRNFNRCPANAVCTLASASAPSATCSAVAGARTKACSAAQTAGLVLDPFNATKPVLSVRGEITNPSLWDSPDGCTQNNPKRRPEGVVKVVLSKPVKKLTLSTDQAFTSFDTSAYLIAGCAAQPTDAWCNDDQGPEAVNRQQAVLVLENVPARADYWLIVDSFNAPSSTSSTMGTKFQVNITVEE